jgi:2-keto-4-pentenoate hydratase/2-oxohepta-3-ene-1,7-dioic acid hydratase in catechol pathway
MPLIVRFSTSSGPLYGLIVEGAVHALAAPSEAGPFGGSDLVPGERVGPLDAIRLLPPVAPSKILCIGRNYAAHAAEHSAPVPAEPMLFLKPPSALIGQGGEIVLPRNAGRVEHEAELAVIIGRTASHVRREDALNYVLGYTCANDVSARDYQKKDGQWGRAKGFDTFCPLGPWIATGIDPSDLAIACHVNGEQRQGARTSDMVFDVAALIAFVSAVMTLLPGDVLLTGTPSGVSPLAAGDTVEVTIEGIGTLRNTVRDAG